MLDFNCFIGQWPFHPLKVETLEQLQALHRENGIEGGFVSSLKSLFYRDYFESEQELYETLKGTEYRQVMTVNPLFPACLDVVRYGIENWNIAGVRVVPTYHGYDLTAPELEELCQVLKEAGLPLFLTLSLEDIRNSYLLIPKPLPANQIKQWLDEHHDLTILICGGSSYGGVNFLKEQILAHPAAFFEPSGMRNGSFPFEYIGPEICTRLVYGSMSGILCLKSSLLHIEMGELSPEQLERSSDGRDFLSKCPGIK